MTFFCKYGGTQVRKTVYVGERRSTMNLEPEMWEALDDICVRETLTLNRILTLLASRRPRNLTGAVRVFIVSYLRGAAQEGVLAVHQQKSHAVPADRLAA
ncbi:ribbon-helix-helix domain-containing protein (plasmid) [Azospirillum sp. HJ39]|uniref:ribbon-helix-helix domain-containing protein n=1 Tax=Azospirillum sp. HJ39 TaxID=3159496 RepID=UPI003558DE60